jgi:hypothetical protein
MMRVVLTLRVRKSLTWSVRTTIGHGAGAELAF